MSMTNDEYQDTFNKVVKLLKGCNRDDAHNVLEASAVFLGAGKELLKERILVESGRTDQKTQVCSACGMFMGFQKDVYNYEHLIENAEGKHDTDVQHADTDRNICKTCFDLRRQGKLRVWSVLFDGLNGPCVHRSIAAAVSEVDLMLTENDYAFAALEEKETHTITIESYVMTRADCDALPEFEGY